MPELTTCNLADLDVYLGELNNLFGSGCESGIHNKREKLPDTANFLLIIPKYAIDVCYT